MSDRNFVAKSMFDRRSPFKAKTVETKKGKGSFKRKDKYPEKY